MINTICSGIEHDTKTNTISGTIDDFISVVKYHHLHQSKKTKTKNTSGAEYSVFKYLYTKDEITHKWGKSKLDYIFHNDFHIKGNLNYELKRKIVKFGVGIVL